MSHLEHDRGLLQKITTGISISYFSNIILSIHEDYIPSYNASGRALLEKLKIKLEIEKEEAQKADKLAGD